MPRSFLPILLLAALLPAVGVDRADAQARRAAKVAVIQAEGSPRQDPFMASYDFSKVEPMMEAHLDKILGLLAQAGEKGADLVCGPEDIQHIGAYGLHLDVLNPKTGEDLFSSLAVKVPGPLTDRIAGIAKKYHMYIVAPLYEKVDGKVFNSAVVFDREGKIIGKHHKTVLPILETWDVAPGDEYEVFETDFCKFAIATCWEIIFPEISAIYALKGADIIFNPTMGPEHKAGQSLSTGARYITRARDNLVYFAPVILGSDGNGIIDYNGKVVAEAVGQKNSVIMAEIDFAKEPTSDSKWWNTINGSDNDRAIYYLNRRPETYKLLTDPNPPVLERYRDVELTTGRKAKQLEAVKAVNYGP